MRFFASIAGKTHDMIRKNQPGVIFPGFFMLSIGSTFVDRSLQRIVHDLADN
jgi:hypothetical protein